MKRSSSYRLLLALLLTSAHALSGTTVHAEDKSKATERETLEEKLHRRKMVAQHFHTFSRKPPQDHGEGAKERTQPETEAEVSSNGQRAKHSKIANQAPHTAHSEPPPSTPLRRTKTDDSKKATRPSSGSHNHIFGNPVSAEHKRRGQPETSRGSSSPSARQPASPRRRR